MKGPGAYIAMEVGVVVVVVVVNVCRRRDQQREGVGVEKRGAMLCYLTRRMVCVSKRCLAGSRMPRHSTARSQTKPEDDNHKSHAPI